MHIPDGFIAPVVYLPLYVVAAGAWAYSARRVRATLDEGTLPFLAVMTSAAFVLMMVAIPLPGGTTVHASGVGLLAVLFGVWTTFLAVSLVLLLQALLFGAGGVTALPINALAMGLAGATAAWLAFRGLRGWSEPAALFVAGAVSVLVPALLVAVALGIQPLVAHGPDGTPRFFPFGLSITLPAVLLPHLVVAAGEGVLTGLAFRYVSSLRAPRAA
jgi:cobalt/nickel transport system permease protein